MAPQARIAALTSNNGNHVSLPKTGVTCIVGGNNVGKSQVLRDIMACLGDPSARPVALNLIEVAKSPASEVEVRSWLWENAVQEPGRQNADPSYAPLYGGNSLTAEQFVTFFERQPNSLWHTSPFLAKHVGAGGLLPLAVESLGTPGMSALAGPLSRLFRDGKLEKTLSDLCREVFQFPLTLDRVNGNVRLRIGESNEPVPPLNNPTIEYADSVAELPLLESQGDGVKSFLGLALTVVAGDPQILLVDEPEAFLHPAQSRALGRWAATEAFRRDRQVIVATHDRDFVLGLLDSDAPITILRVSRKGTQTSLHQLHPTDVTAVWNDPVLRYSNVLQGLFHSQVVVCEADADCRFYGATLDVLATERGVRGKADDTLFVPSGGKQRVATLVRSLRALSVKAHAIVDFDVLRSRADVQGILEALGGVWTDGMNGDYVAVATVANEKGLWDTLKHLGISGLPAGNTYIAGTRLLEALKLENLHIVPVGEMEDFNKSLGVHGASWVSGMLEANQHKTCQPVRDLVEPFLSS